MGTALTTGSRRDIDPATARAATRSARLERLAEEIRGHEVACAMAIRVGLEHHLQSGRKLREAKRLAGPGGWLVWLEQFGDLFNQPERAAQRRMRFAKLWDANTYLHTHLPTDLSLDGAIAWLLEQSKPPTLGIDGGGEATEVAVAAGEGASWDGERFRLIHNTVDAAAADVPAGSVDLIVTDPPYPLEFLQVHGALAAFASHALKPGGSLLAMVGHIYLPDILGLMTPHLTYQWTMAYLLGGSSAAIWSRRALVGWKPVLWFVKGQYRGEPVTDVYRSDRVEKQYHDWGQSESGIDDILHRFAKQDDLVCDPFVGGGSTAVVALTRGCRFLGIDQDERAIQATAGRIAALQPDDE